MFQGWNMVSNQFFKSQRNHFFKKRDSMSEESTKNWYNETNDSQSRIKGGQRRGFRKGTDFEDHVIMNVNRFKNLQIFLDQEKNSHQKRCETKC